MNFDLTAKERKQHPLYRGLFKYFPHALMYVAFVSKIGNDQHNPGEDLHWAMEKSTDEGDALLRHQLDAGTIDTDGVRHSGKVAWRALAQLERELLAAMEEDAQIDQWAEEANAALSDDLEQQMVDDSATMLAQDVDRSINRMTDYVEKAERSTLTVTFDHGADNGELPQPHGSRPSHYEGDFGSLAISGTDYTVPGFSEK